MADLKDKFDSFAEFEEEICKKWGEEETFKNQDRLAEERGDKEYTFYDGPPFATGLPHYGHILAGTIKDVVTRYACMTGHRVRRRAGWDCHGLPVEYEIDQQLNITHRDQVLEMGIDKYNATCRGIVSRYTKEWEVTTKRLGRWIDFENDYKTMDPTFMESVWWVFGELYKKGLVYQGFKVMPFSTACGTPLSNFEAGLNYKDVRDPAVVVSFPLKDDPTVSFVAWTTTPWTLPSNLALCVHPELDYVKIRDTESDKCYILAKSRLCQLYPLMNNKKKWKPAKAADFFTVLENFKGKDLVGKTYAPLFDFFNDNDKYFRVLSDTYVTDDSGTGIVHQAPAFGEDDYRVCLAHGIIYKGQKDIPCPVDSSGRFTAPVDCVLGKHVKEADKDLMALLKTNGRLVQKDNCDHSYPFCWRSDTPLIYRAVPSWFIKVEEIRDRIVENNKKTYWVPNAVKEGRFHSWLVDARDWAVSRNRFWGTPIPIWADEDLDEVVCISSIAQLKELSGVEATDLHRESVDDITIPSKKKPGTVLRRIDEVFDCWFESGSMPYAQQHYPFENKERFEQGFPADFVAEGLDQTRGWFYTLMVLSTALFGEPAFKNLICNGLVLAEDGKKMSKRLKNYPDPTLVIDKYGADALRMYLINSPVVRAESLKFREDGVRGVAKDVFLRLYHAFRLLLQNVERWEAANNGAFVPDVEKVRATTNPTDVWISAATQRLIKYVREEMEAYRLYTVMPELVRYIDQLTNWYIRLNRERLKGMVDGEDAETGLQVLYDVLSDVTVLMAPFTPFITEFLYQHLRKRQPSYLTMVKENTAPSNPPRMGEADSVHFLQIPTYDETRSNARAVAAMNALQVVVEQGRTVRERRNISLRTPVRQVVVVLRDRDVVEDLTGSLKEYVLSELNAWDFVVVPKEEEKDWVKMSLLPDLKVLGRKLGKQMKAVKKAIVEMTHEEAVAALEAGSFSPVEGVVIDSSTEIISKLSFAKEGVDHWEAATDGASVVAVDCAQDDAIVSAGRARELINVVQRLRKEARLDISDRVEAFFKDDGGDDGATEKIVADNLATLVAKFRGGVPLPDRLRVPGAEVLGTETAEIGGGDDKESRVTVTICRPVAVARDDAEPEIVDFLSKVDASADDRSAVLVCEINGTKRELVEGTDFWYGALDKAKATKALEWLR